MWKVYFKSPLVGDEFYALYFFIFWGFFIALHSFPLYGWLGNSEHRGVSPRARHSALFCASVLRFAFWHTLPSPPAFSPMSN